MKTNVYGGYGDFVVFLAVDSDDFSRKHLIKALAKRLQERSKILCVNRPICPLVTTIKHRKKMAVWLKYLFYKNGSLRKLSDNLYFYTPFLFLHDQLAPKIPFMRQANRRILSFQLNRVLRRLQFNTGQLIVWIFNPYQLDYVDLLDEKYLIYDCYDEYLAPTSFRNNALLRQLEERDREILRKAHIVFAVSKPILEKRREFNKNIYSIPNAADYNHFKKALDEKTPIPDDITSIPHPIIGFVGNMNQSIDFNLLAFLAHQRPEWSFVLIGTFNSCERGFMHSQELREARSCKNIYFVGSRPFEQIPCYLKAFDVCIIPYKDSELNRSRCPVKLYEYMASGNSIVSTDLPEIRPFSDFVNIAKTPNDFASAIQDLLENSEADISIGRLKVAEKNTWKKRAAKVVSIIEVSLKKKDG